MRRKEEIRQELRRRRDAIPDDERRRRSAQIWSNLLAVFSPSWQRVGLYASFKSEVETDGLFDLLRQRRTVVFYPRCEQGGRELVFVAVTDLSELRCGAYGIREPVGPASPVSDLDVLLVPGLGFDQAGGRIGYGKGYYDVTLSKFGKISFGLAYTDQIVAEVPRCGHDQLVESVITELGILGADSGSGEVACPM